MLGSEIEERLFLLQVDLCGHSAWAARNLDRVVARARAGFSSALKRELKPFQFERLYWLGDGGVFYRKYEGTPGEADRVLLAADAAFRVFRECLGEHAELQMRASATLMNVLTSSDPSDWFSPDLNEFLKYEREIALPNAFVITWDLFKNLEAEARMRFPKVRSVPLPNGNNRALYTDTRHPFTGAQSPKGFQQWLTKNARKLPPSSWCTRGMRDRDVMVGDAVVVNTAWTEEGYGRLEMRPVTFPSEAFEERIRKVSVTGFEDLRKKHSGLQGTKAAPLRLECPSTDEPRLLIEYADVPYGGLSHFSGDLASRLTRATV